MLQTLQSIVKKSKIEDFSALNQLEDLYSTPE